MDEQGLEISEYCEFRPPLSRIPLQLSFAASPSLPASFAHGIAFPLGNDRDCISRPITRFKREEVDGGRALDIMLAIMELLEGRLGHLCKLNFHLI